MILTNVFIHNNDMLRQNEILFSMIIYNVCTISQPRPQQKVDAMLVHIHFHGKSICFRPILHIYILFNILLSILPISIFLIIWWWKPYKFRSVTFPSFACCVIGQNGFTMFLSQSHQIGHEYYTEQYRLGPILYYNRTGGLW